MKRLFAITAIIVLLAAASHEVMAMTPALKIHSAPRINFTFKPSAELDKQISNGVDAYLKEHPIYFNF